MYFVWALMGLAVFAFASVIGGAGAHGVFFSMLTGAVLGVLWARQNRLRGELAQMRVLLDRSLARRAATPTPSSEAARVETPAAANPERPPMVWEATAPDPATAFARVSPKTRRSRPRIPLQRTQS